MPGREWAGPLTCREPSGLSEGSFRDLAPLLEYLLPLWFIYSGAFKAKGEKWFRQFEGKEGGESGRKRHREKELNLH